MLDLPSQGASSHLTFVFRTFASLAFNGTFLTIGADLVVFCRILLGTGALHRIKLVFAFARHVFSQGGAAFGIPSNRAF